MTMRIVSIDPNTNIVTIRDSWDGPVVRTLSWNEYEKEEQEEIDRLIAEMPEGKEKEDIITFRRRVEEEVRRSLNGGT